MEQSQSNWSSGPPPHILGDVAVVSLCWVGWGGWRLHLTYRAFRGPPPLAQAFRSPKYQTMWYKKLSIAQEIIFVDKNSRKLQGAASLSDYLHVVPMWPMYTLCTLGNAPAQNSKSLKLRFVRVNSIESKRPTLHPVLSPKHSPFLIYCCWHCGHQEQRCPLPRPLAMKT